MVKDNKKGFGYYIGICEKGLPDRSTQKEIKRYLGQLFPEVYFTKNDIEEIKVLS